MQRDTHEPSGLKMQRKTYGGYEAVALWVCEMAIHSRDRLTPSRRPVIRRSAEGCLSYGAEVPSRRDYEQKHRRRRFL